MEQIKSLEAKAADVYRYMSFDKIPEFVDIAKEVQV
jgi:aconitate hydratase 2/2-methylisocitrate dehydratase